MTKEQRMRHTAKPGLENDNQQTIFNNKILGNSTGKIVQKASDKLKGVFCSVILLVLVYYLTGS